MSEQYQPTILITGATRGMGRAIAYRFAEAGFRLALTARTREDVAALATELKEKYPGREVIPLPADVSDAQAVQRLADAVADRWPRLDVLVNCAGLFLPDRLLTAPEHNLDRSLQTNLYGPYRLCRALAPLMLPYRQGLIINIGSVASLRAYPESASYVISKHALLGMSRALRLELQDQGIKVTTLLPGPTWTSSWEGEDIDPEQLMAAEDVADAAFAAWALGPRSVLEEVVMKPLGGDSPASV